MDLIMSSRKRRRLDEAEEEEEEELVREVLRDFPPEERGERDEWKEHVGWHRKENIRKRVVHDKSDSYPTHRDVVEDAEKNMMRQNQSFAHRNPTLFLAALPLLLALGLFAASKFLCKRSKSRTV